MSDCNKYYCLDARKIDKLVSPNSVQTTITSPPYFGVKSYSKSVIQIGWDQDYDEYLSAIENVFGKCLDATSETGTLWLVIDTYRRDGRLKLLPFDVVNSLEGIGWIPQDIIIWDKVKNLPYTRRGQFRNNFEYILLFSKTDRFKYYIDRIREIDSLEKWWIRYPERYNPKGKVPENIWRIPIPLQGSWGNGSIQHLCPFPPRLVERLILLSTDEDELVLDPFAGSGVALAQARCMKRRFIGCDINEEYVRRFYSDVLPEMEAMREEREKVLARHQIMQEELSKFIISLRKLKYGKVILKKAIDKYGQSYFRSLVLNSGDSQDDFLIFIILVLASDSDLALTEVRAWLEKQTSVRPLSKFGLTPTIEVVSEDRIYDYIKPENQHFYLNGKFYDKAKGVNSDIILNECGCDFPPIISDIDICEETIRNSSLPYP